MNGKRTSLGSRILAMLLVAVMVIGMVPTTVFADSTANPLVEGSNADTILAYAQGKLDENHDKTGQYTWDTEKKDDGWRYFNGLMLEAFLRNGLKANETENALTFAQKYFDHNVKEGSSLSAAITNYHMDQLDSVPPARVLAQLVGHVGFDDPKYANALQLVYDEIYTLTQYTDCGYNFIHKSSWTDWNIGLDGVYMGHPFFLEIAKAMKEGRITSFDVHSDFNKDGTKNYLDIVDEAYARLYWICDSMDFTDAAGNVLYHHGWDVDAQKGNGVVWARGTGWFAAGLVDCIMLMEDIGYDSGKVAALKGYLKTLLDGMLAYQDEDTGLWYNVVYDSTQPTKSGSALDSDNRLETSGTGLMAYTLLVAYTEGWLGETYGAAGVKAIDGIMQNKWNGSKFTDIYKMSGVATSADQYCLMDDDHGYSSDEAKGTGAIILAASMYDDAVAGTSYAETYQIGLVNVTELDVVNGAVQTSGLKATVVGSKGTIKDVAAAGLDTAVNGSNVEISYNGNVIATVAANIIDVSDNVSDTGSLTITPDATAPSGGTTTAEGTVTVEGSTTGGTPDGTFSKLSGNLTADSYQVAIVWKNGKYQYSETAGASKSTAIDVTETNGKYTLEKSYLWTLTRTSDGYYTISSADGYYVTSSPALSNKASDAEKFSVIYDATNGYYNFNLTSNTKKYLAGKSDGFQLKESTTANETAPKLYTPNVSGGSTETKDYTVTLTTTDTGKLLGNTDPVQLNAGLTVSPEADIDGDIVWASDNTDVATVSADGKVTAVANGNANITATVSKVTVAGKEVTLENALVVTIPVTVALGASYDITLNCTGVSVEQGGSANLAPSITFTPDSYTGDKTPVWTMASANESIATVADNGVVTGVATGTTDITVTLVSVGGVEVSGVSVTVPVAVTEKTCEHTYTTSVTAPTCTKQGYTTHTCSKCNYSYEGSFVNATGHSFGAYTETKAPTCGAAGEKTATCSLCGAVDAKAIAATGEHNYADGSCTLCGGTEPGYVEPSVDFNTPSVDGATESAATIVAGGSISLTASLTNADNYSLSWSILENADYATLVDNGDGTATVTAKTNVVTPVVVKIQAKLTKLTRAAADTYTATYDITINPTAADKTGDWEIIEYTTTGGESTGGTAEKAFVLDTDGTINWSKGEYIVVYEYTDGKLYALTNDNGNEGITEVTITDNKVNVTYANASSIIWTFDNTNGNQVYNNGRYLRTGNNSIFNATNTNTIDSVTVVDKSKGQYGINLGDNRYLKMNDNTGDWNRTSSGTVDKLYFYEYTTTGNTTGGSTTPAQTNPSKWAQLTYKDYTVVAGSITEEALIAQIKADCSIATNNASDGSGDTTGTYDWANATLTWDKTLDTDAAGTYKATVTVPVTDAPEGKANVATLGTITVTVEAACEHTNTETIPGKPATCAATGLTEGEKCSTCGTIITAQTVIPTIAHTPETVAGTPATCYQAGLSDGEKCSVCDAVITAQTDIPATGNHVYGADNKCTTPGCTAVTQSATDYIHDFTIGNVETGDTFKLTLGSGGVWETNPVDAYKYNDQLVHYVKMTPDTAVTFNAPSAGTLTLKMKGRANATHTDTIIVTLNGTEIYNSDDLDPNNPTEVTDIAITGSGEVVVKGTSGQPALYYIEFVPDSQYYLVGSKDLTGYDWALDDGWNSNSMTDNGDGTWSITFNNVPAGTHEYKVYDGTTWYGNSEGKNYSFTNQCPADVTLTFDTNTLKVSSNVTLKHSYTSVVTAPTCTEGGYTTYTCACGESYIADETAALGHDFNENNICGNCQGTRVFLAPNSNWKADNARFAVYHFDGNGNDGWYSMLDEDGDGVYEAVVPAGHTSLIFVRMTPSDTTNNWDNDWNQTTDLTTPTDGNVYFTVNEGQWGDNTTGATGVWGEPPHVHEMTYVGPVGASCTEDGHYEYYSCSGCGKLFKDEEGKEETTLADLTIKANGSHKGGEATCQNKAVCSSCGQEYGELNAENHASPEFTYSNSTNDTHDKAHACCGAVAATGEAHTFVNGECACGQTETAETPTVFTKVETTTGDGTTKYFDATAITSGKKYVILRDGAKFYLTATNTSAGVTWGGNATDGYTVSNIDVWTVQDSGDGYFYLVNASGKYLAYQQNNNNLIIADAASEYTKFTLNPVSGEAGGFNLVTKAANANNRKDVQVQESGGAKLENSSKVLIIREQQSGTTTVTEYYAISPITATYDAGTEENIANAIKARITLWKATDANGTGASPVSTADLTVDTSAVKVGVPGEYEAIVYMTVGEEQVEIGRVSVTINEVEQEVTYTYAIHGTVADVIVGGTPNFGNITVTKHGSDNSTHTYEASDLTFSTVDTSTAGEKTVTVTVDGQSFTLKFNVKESAGALEVIVHPDTLNVPRHGYEEILLEVRLGEQTLQPGDYTITWTSSNPAAATITQSEDNKNGGIVYGVEQGTTDITASVVYTDASGNVYNGSATTTTTTTTTTTESVQSDPVMVDSTLSGGDRTYNRVNTIAGLAALDYSDGGAEVILVFNQGSHYAADITDSLGFDSQRLKPTLISGDTYSLATYSSSYTYANRWYITKGTAANSYYLSAKVGEKTYYLSHANDELALVETQSADCLWNVLENNSSGSSVIAMTFYYLDTDGKYNQLQTDSSTMGIATDRSELSKSNERQAVVYVPNEVGGEAVYTYARVNGITSYVIQQGDTLTEAMILENIKVQLESSSNPGVWEDLAWTDSRINYNWRGVNLDSNTAGRYAMAIRVNNQLVHRVFVTVEPAAYTVEISTEGNASSVAMDSTLQATAVIKDGNGNTVTGTITWSSSSSALASVDANGLISGKINGDVTITASTVIGGRTYTATKKITVTSKVNYEKYIQNLTTEGFEDNLGFYTFGGNHNVGNADPITYNGSDLDTFMKMESSTAISFTAEGDNGKFIVVAAKTSATVKLVAGNTTLEPTIDNSGDYTVYTFEGLTDQTVYTLKKDSSQALVAYWEFQPGGVAHETVSINIELEGDEDELVMGGTLTQGTAYAEVTIAGVMSTNEPVTWASEDTSIVSIDENGVYTAVGVGQTYITATYKHTYADGTEDTYVDRYLIFVLDGNAIASAKLSQDTITFDKGAIVTKESFVDANGNPITLTLINAKGEETTINLTDENIGLGDLDTLTSVAGTKTVLVSYNGVAYLPINVRVVDKALDAHDGRVFQEVNVIYSLDIDGIDDGKEYVLVAVTEAPAEGSNTWKGVALLNPNDSTSNTKGTIMAVTGDLTTRTITFTGTAAEIANAKEFGLWTFNLVSKDSYLIVNSNRNFRENSSYLTKADNDENDAVTVEAYTAEGAYYFNLGSSNWLSYYDGAWVRTKTSSADATVYLFEKISETATVGADLVSITAPDQEDIHVGNAFTSVPTVHVNDTPTTDYTIEWTSSDPAVATVDANGKISYLKEGTATITATLTHIGGEEVTVNENKSLSMSFDVTVPLETTSLQITPSNIVVPLNGTVDLSEVRIVRVRQTIVNGEVTDTTYEPLDSSLITFDLVGANNKQGVDTSVADASYQVDTYYDGVKQGAVTVNIGHDVFDGRDTATSLPEYPSGGAVRVDKTAVTAEGFSFSETGVSKVEISAAGVTTQSDIDVILVVDVSNSMAWSMDWFEGLSDTSGVSDAKKLPDGGVEGTDKLDMAMAHASTFADILLEDGNNSLTFVTFAGSDTDNGGSNYDSVQTVFTGVTDASKAKTSFAGTRYTALSGSSDVTVTLQITDENGNKTSGTNRGNTNYDYAFGQAMSAIRDMKDQWEADETKNPNGLTYEESGRQIHVVFMTDGAPSHYNGVRNGGSTSDTIYGTSTKYSNKSYSDTDWTAYIEQPNTLATELYNTPGVTGFHTVGFDLAHGGFGSYTASEADMTYVLRGLVTSQDLDVVSATDEAQLQNFFESLAHSLTMAGREAYVTDIVGADYTLYMGTELLDANGGAIEGVPSEVNVKLYTLVTPSLIAQDSRFNTSQIGQRVCDIEVDGVKIGEITSGENQNVTILETITFNNGVPTSSVAGELTVTDGGFKADTFEYKVVDGKGNITWTIGDITHREISLSYYAHLNGVADGDSTLPANGTYFTNESAHITYIDANDDKAVQEFPKPAMAFGSASIRVRFVLVTEDGRYANNMGNAFGSDIHANRIYATEEYMMNVGLNSETTFDADKLAQIVQQTGISAKYLPLVQNASFTIGNGSGEEGADITKGLSGLTWEGAMATPWTDGSGHTHDLDTLLVVTDKTGDGSYSQAIVEIPVVSLGGETAQNRLFTASTVIDFGTPVDFEIAHDLEIEAFKADGYVMTVVGFAPYSASFDQKLMLKPAQVGAGTKDMLATESGVFSIKTAGDSNAEPVITFTPTAPINGVQKAFATIRFSVPGQESTSYYYMYKEINVIPANMMLVESDATVNVSGLGYSKAYEQTTREFATGFTYTGDWQQQSSGAISNQSNANENYGFDAGYANYANYAGNVMFVNNDGTGTIPTVKFSFTGTGFDLISRTGDQQAMISVVVSQNGKEVKRQVILLKSQDELYQIPVTSIEGLAYGTYDVVITVNSAFSIGSYEMGGEFYFDGIRVYNAAMNDASANSAYKQAGEHGMILQEIRELLLAAESFGDGLVGDLKGALYFDGNDLHDGDPMPDGETFVTSYNKIGPKNEIYLSGGQAVAFKLGFSGELPTTLDLGLKLAKVSAGGSATATVTIYNASDVAAATVTTQVKLNTATAMFYNILGEEQLSSLVDDNNQIIVVISYEGEANLNDILSITDLKAGFSGDSVGKFEVISSTATVAAANLTLNPEFNVKSAQFESDHIVAMQTTTLTVVTSAGVDSILVTDENGNEIGVSADFMDTADGDRVWTILVRPTASGQQTFTVTGVGADGQTGESAFITATVNLF